MPELPEVENARRLIAEQALGRRIVSVDDADTFVCRPHSPGELRDALTGRLLSAAHRRGKAMWCETSEVLGGPPGPGPDLGIHLGMSGRIVVTSPDGESAEGGDPPGRDAQPRQAGWNRFTLDFADGGHLVLFDKRRLGRIQLNPDIDALGPDAGAGHAGRVPGPDHQGHDRGQGPPAGPVQDRRSGKPAGRRGALAGQGAARHAGQPPAAQGCRPYLPRPAFSPGLRNGQGRRTHRRRHRGPAAGRQLPALRRRDEARNRRRPLHLVVLPRTGLATRGRRALAGCP